MLYLNTFRPEYSINLLLNSAMQNQKVIEVLGRYRITIKILNLFNFDVSNIRSLDNLYALLATIPHLAMVLTMILEIWFFFEHKFNLDEISFSIPIFIGSVQVVLVSLSVIGDNEMIDEAINDLQTIVDNRKILLRLCSFCRVIYRILFFNSRMHEINGLIHNLREV